MRIKEFLQYPWEGTVKASWHYIVSALQPKNFTFIEHGELAVLLASNAPPLVVDVRHQRVYSDFGHIAGAISQPMPEFMDTCRAIPKDRPIVTVCYFGYYNQAAARRLTDLGHRNVRALRGGMEAWNMAERPTVKGETAAGV